MKLFSILCILALLGALLAPFFLTVNGKPMLSLDEVLDDAAPDTLDTPATVYRWQDEQGQWHFGEAAPEDRRAEQISVEERITALDDGWHVKPLTGDGEKPALGIAAPGIAGYVSAGQQLMDNAATQVDALNERTAQLEALRRRAD